MDIFEELEQMEDTAEFKATFFALQVSNQLGVLLDSKGWSMSELAARMGVSRQYVHQILSGKQNVTLKKLAEVCFALQVDPASLLSKPAKQQSFSLSGLVSVPQSPGSKSHGAIQTNSFRYSSASLSLSSETFAVTGEIDWVGGSVPGGY